MVKLFAIACALVAREVFGFSTIPSSTAGGGPTTASHEFWRKERSEAQVKAHIEASLDRVEHCNLQATIEVVSAEPPLVIIHDFLSSQMCQDIIDTAKETQGLERSTTGESNRKSTSRTSSTVWLNNDDGCPEALQVIADKLCEISGLPPTHMENLQVCRYLPGQEFRLHTDHQDSFNDLDCRGRVATCLVYLAEPLGGGETWFPGLGDSEESEPKIAPSRGSAVFFWNTVERPGSPSYDPLGDLNVDMQMRHAGLPVDAGEKWICNRWVHPIDINSSVRGTYEPSRSSV